MPLDEAGFKAARPPSGAHDIPGTRKSQVAENTALLCLSCGLFQIVLKFFWASEPIRHGFALCEETKDRLPKRRCQRLFSRLLTTAPVLGCGSGAATVRSSATTTTEWLCRRFCSDIPMTSAKRPPKTTRAQAQNP